MWGLIAVAAASLLTVAGAQEPNAPAITDMERVHLRRAGDAASKGDCATALHELTPFIRPEKERALGPLAGRFLTVAGLCTADRASPDTAYPLLFRATRAGGAPEAAWRYRLWYELDKQRFADAVATLEAMANGDAAVLNAIEPKALYALDESIRAEGHVALRRRLLEVLAASYSPDPVSGDSDPFRLRYARLLLKAGNRNDARAVLQGAATPSVLRVMMLDADLRDALPAGFSIKTATERRLAADMALVAAYPDRLSPLLGAASNLRQLGRPEEALKLLEAARGKVEGGGFSDTADQKPWWWDGMYRSALMLGQPEVAIGYLRVGMNVSEEGGRNVSQVLNLASVLNDLGRPGDALAVLGGAGALGPMSLYGATVLHLARGCAHAQLGHIGEAAKARAFLETHRSDSPSNLTEMLLCQGDLDAAAATTVAQLADPEVRSEVLAAFSQYAPPPVWLPKTRVEQNRERLATRTDVQTALAAAGGSVTFDVQRQEH